MAYLNDITLTQFRNYDFRRFSFHKKVVGITGLNGSGKTNLLDGIYYLIFTKSYFQSRETNNVLYGKNGFRIEGNLKGEEEEHLVIVWRDGKKTIQSNGAPLEKITRHIGKYAAVMIAPDDISLINGGSELRRKFIDGILSQADNKYFDALLLYQKVLQQKNAYLKMIQPYNIQYSLLDIYDEQLAASGTYLTDKRKEFSASVPVVIQDFYEKISGGTEAVGLQYKMAAPNSDLHRLFLYNRNRDIDYHRTTAGPHTEDWLFTIDHQPMKSHASQGQKKSFLISLKLAQLAHLLEVGKTPILLLDDIFEKLDGKRLACFFSLLKSLALEQILVTHTNESEWKEFAGKYFGDIQTIQL